MTRVLLEVCAGSSNCAAVAAAAGADRIELNCALESGGLTPSASAISAACRLSVPVVVMIRPRAGAFGYDDGEIDVMARDIRDASARGARGVAFGVLDGERVNQSACRHLLAAAGSIETVFHRAFDTVPDQIATLEQLVDLGFTRVLTSGGAPTAPEGVDRLAELHACADGRIEILPGAGITVENVGAIIERTGCHQVHGSFRHPPSGPPGVFGSYESVDAEGVAAVRSRLPSD